MFDVFESPSGWTVDYPEVPPDPAPVTTIVWRMLHISDGNTIYWEHAFGPGLRNFWDLAPHGDAVGAIEYLTESQGSITATLLELDDDALDEMRPTQFGVDWPARRVLSVLIDEQVHHGAEIALLRDLYKRARYLRMCRARTDRTLRILPDAAARDAEQIEAPMFVKGCFGGAGRPVMGHSGEGKLL